MVKCLVVLAIAVGCHHDKPAEDPTGPSVLGQGGGDTTDRSGNMIPSDKMDEVQQDLKRKQMIMSHCLATAMENKEVPKNAHGKIAVELVITPEGKATSVKLIHSDIDSKSVTDCVIRHVEEISFPQLPKSYETSFTYAMDAN